MRRHTPREQGVPARQTAGPKLKRVRHQAVRRLRQLLPLIKARASNYSNFEVDFGLNSFISISGSAPPAPCDVATPLIERSIIFHAAKLRILEKKTRSAFVKVLLSSKVRCHHLTYITLTTTPV